METTTAPDAIEYKGHTLTITSRSTSRWDRATRTNVPCTLYLCLLDGREYYDLSGYTPAKALAAAKRNIDRQQQDDLLRPSLVQLVASYDSSEAAAAAVGAPTGSYQLGQVVVAFSRNALRRGVVTKVGRTNIEFAYTTAGAVDGAARYGLTPTVTRKTVKVAEVAAAGAVLPLAVAQ